MSNKFLIGKIADLFFEKGIERDLPGALKEVYYLGPDRASRQDRPRVLQEGTGRG